MGQLLHSGGQKAPQHLLIYLY